MENDLLIFKKLNMSKFRSSFYLKKKDLDYINEKGIETIKKHCVDFINNRLSDISTFNDGKQTPMKGHPVFIAMHATATCCRGCLYKWHHIESTHVLTNDEKNYIYKIIMTWIYMQIKKNK